MADKAARDAAIAKASKQVAEGGGFTRRPGGCRWTEAQVEAGTKVCPSPLWTRERPQNPADDGSRDVDQATLVRAVLDAVFPVGEPDDDWMDGEIEHILTAWLAGNEDERVSVRTLAESLVAAVRAAEAADG